MALSACVGLWGCSQGGTEPAPSTPEHPAPAAPAAPSSAAPHVEPRAQHDTQTPATAQQERLLAAQAQARALAAGLPPARAPSTAYDCGEDLSCFAERGKRCESVAVRHALGTRMGATVTDLRVGGDRDGDLCQYQQQTVAMQMAPPTEAMRKALEASGQDMATHDARAASAFEDMKAKGEDKVTCYYPRERLEQVLDDWVAGRTRGTSDDWEQCYLGNGECTDAPLAAGCSREACTHGRLTFRCSREGRAESCTTPGKGGLRINDGFTLDCKAGKVSMSFKR